MSDNDMDQNPQGDGHFQDPPWKRRRRPRQQKKAATSRQPQEQQKLPPPPSFQAAIKNNKSTQQQQPLKKDYELPPLVLEGATISRFALSQLLKKKMPEVKLNNIQLNRSGSFTLYASDVTSYNALLTNFPSGDLPNSASVKIFIPRSIQRIQKTDTEAFVKRVDKEISDEEIRTALMADGYQITVVDRLLNKEKTAPGTSIKITFIDVYNRDAFVKQGLKIDHMHFVAEKAKQKTTPQQCHNCWRYGHIAKFCTQQQQSICDHCTGSHRSNVCEQKHQQPKCNNCHGIHESTCQDCPKYKEEQKRLQSAVDRYSYSSTPSRSTGSTRSARYSSSLHDNEHYPPLSSTAHPSNTPQISSDLIEAVTAAALAAVERATERLFDIFTTKFEKFTRRVLATLNLPADETVSSEYEYENDDDEQPSMQQPQQQLMEELPSSSIQQPVFVPLKTHVMTHSMLTQATADKHMITKSNGGVKRPATSLFSHVTKRVNNSSKSRLIPKTTTDTAKTIVL